jgi:multisubunit Na+/H+ antiporter MnhE subunit
MSIFNYKQRNNIILVSIIVLGCFLLYALSELFSSILGAIVLFTIFRPFYLYMVERRNFNRAISAANYHSYLAYCYRYPVPVVKYYGDRENSRY